MIKFSLIRLLPVRILDGKGIWVGSKNTSFRRLEGKIDHIAINIRACPLTSKARVSRFAQFVLIYGAIMKCIADIFSPSGLGRQKVYLYATLELLDSVLRGTSTGSVRNFKSPELIH